MSKKFSLIVFTLLLLAIPAYAANPVPGDVLVVLKNQSGISVKSVGGAAHLSSVQAFAKDAKVQVTRTYDALSESGENIFMLVHSDNEDEKALLEKIKAMPGVVGASLNRRSYLMEDRIPNDPDYYQLWGMQAINAPEIWSKNTGSDEVYVAVIDTGIDPTHEDLMTNLATEYSRNFTGYGKAGYDSTNYTDMRNHGSHCSGTIAAVGNNGLGVAGVNWKTKIIALRVFGSEYADDSDVVAALNYVFSLLRDHPDLKIASVNMSLGGYQSETPEALMAANDPYWLAMKQLSDTNRTVICVAAGNETVEVGAPTKDKDYEDGQYEKGQYCYPASYLGIDNMIIVAAASYDLSRANFSCYGSNYVDIAAPGVDILSTVRNSTPAFTGTEYINTTSPYSLMNGTSMATPHVAGAVALLKSIYPDATAARIKAALLGGADVTKLTDDGTSQHGFLDLKGAVDFLAEDGAPLIRYTPEHSGVVGQRYKLELIASGKQPISWSIDGELPEGLSFDNGKITGTPTEAGESSVIVYAENDEGSDSFYVTINIEAAEAPKITTTEIEDIAAGMNNMIIILADGSWPMSWDITDNNLKDNGKVSFDTEAGVLVFNPDNTGTYTFTITVENLAGKDSKTFTVKAVEGEEPTIMIDKFPEGVVNVLYDSAIGMRRYEEYELKVNGAKPITWSISEGKLPDGLELNVEEGTIGGAPTVSGDFEFTLVAKNTFGTDSKEFTISVTEESPNFPEKEISFDMYKGIQWQRYFAVNGGGHMTFTVSGDSLPSGISATSSDLTYTIYGAPKETGTYHFVLYASNSYGETSTDVTINIYDPLTITTYFLPNAVKGSEYSYKLSTLNDVALKFEVSSGELPDDLELSDEGEITGTPSESGTFKFTVMATNPNDTDSGFLLKELTLNVVNVPEIVNDTLPNGKSGTLYDAELNAYSDGQVIWSVSAGTLPAGLSMSSNGHIYGQPTSADTYAFTVKAVNATGTVSKDFTITIAPADNSSTPPEDNNNNPPEDNNNNNENGNNSGGQVSNLLPVTARTNILERDVSSLSSGVISTLSTDNSMIAAVLPEFTATETGTYPFRNINIDSNVPVGRRLVWNSFVSDAFDGFVSDAEDSAVFLDSADNVIYYVPSDRVVGVNAYIESGKSYAPVITAVKDSGNSGGNSDNVPGPGEPGGGCNSAAFGVLALAVLALMKKRS